MAKSGVANGLKIATVVVSYFIISISLVFTNKLLMSKEGASIPAPLFVTWFQCLLTAVTCWGLGELGDGALEASFFSQFPKQKIELDIILKVLPLSLLFVGMMTFNNLCLQYVEVSFYLVARSLTIVMNVIFTFILLGESTSFKVCMTLLVVIGGFWMGTDGELNVSFIGLTFGVMSSCFVSLNAVYTKKTLPYVDGNKWRLAFNNNVNASIVFIPLILCFELTTIRDHAALLISPFFWGMMMIAGVFGFLIGIVVVMQINLTSPLTHNISGTAKACVQTLLALWIWQNPYTVKSLLGVGMVIFGSLLYTLVRRSESKSAQSKVVEEESDDVDAAALDQLIDDDEDDN